MMNERPEPGEGSDNWKNRGPVDQQPPGKRLAAVSQPPAAKACVQARTLRNLSFVASLLRWFWVAAALRFIAAHSHEGIRVDDVAKHVRATVRSLERYFRAATGRTMTEEIARLRLERAKRLLVESKEPIKQAARDCGFSDAAYFDRVFLQAEGLSPGEYRRRRRSG